MKILCVGGGPAGLYFAILMKQRDPLHDITVVERNRPHDIFGFGVVFSESALNYLQHEDEVVYQQINGSCQAWDPIEVRFKGQTLCCGGNGFSAISRKRLLTILQARALEVGINVCFSTEVDDLSLLKDYDLVVAADGVNSLLRRTFAEQFQPTIQVGTAKYIWFGTTKLFHALTFLFEENEHGIFGVHAYPYDEQTSTFIVETDEETWHRAGLDRSVAETLAPGKSDLVSMAYCQHLFAKHLDEHELLANNSKWLNFRRVHNQSWHYEHIVLMGDAAHTAHFSVGSGTKMAMEDAIALCQALRHCHNLSAAFEEYERVRKPEVERIQRASLPSQAWWEDFRRYQHFAPEQFAFNFLTHNPRITYEKLQQRDPQFVAHANDWFVHEMMPSLSHEQREKASPLSLPLQLQHMTLASRIALSLQADQVLTDHVTAGKAGLVMLELPNVQAIPVEQLRRAVQAIRASPSPLIGIAISMKDLHQQPAAKEQAAITSALQIAGAIKADLLAFDSPWSHIHPTYILDMVQTALHNQAGQGQALPVLAISLSASREAEGVADDEVIACARLLKQHGCDLILIASEGGDQLRQRLLSDRVRNEVGIPTMLIRDAASADEMKTNILAGRTDLYLLRNT
ncbi:MAG TPA: FAD-dependent monooxygenase [Ktedonobacteraceae bacterium]|nr:FAD-dependent monooxygenase [Ktedonobacteraceae bacterium]